MAELSAELKKELLSMRCHLCRNVLSVPPIMLLNNDGTQMGCGRCKNIKTPSNGRNFALENLAKFFSFPCMHKDCEEIIPWKDVENHENACDKRTIICPMSTCNDFIVVKKLNEHMKEKHEENIHYNALINCTCRTDKTVPNNSYSNIEYKCPITDSEPTINVVISHEHQFLVMSRLVAQNNILELYVATFSNINESFSYDLKLSNSDGISYSILKEHLPVSKYDAINDCFKCMTRQCNLAKHPHSTANIYPKIKQIFLSDFQSVIRNFGSVRYTVTFHPMEGRSSDNLKCRANCKHADLLRKQLQCPICMEYMFQYVYNCENGHVVCKKCEIKLANCPTCRANLGMSRCYPLESLAEEAVLYCQFAKGGCGFTGDLILLFYHEKICMYKDCTM